MSRKGDRYPPSWLESAEVERVLDACGGGRSGVRNRALIAALYLDGDAGVGANKVRGTTRAKRLTI